MDIISRLHKILETLIGTGGLNNKWMQRRAKDMACSTPDRMIAVAGRVQEEWTAQNGCTPMLP